MSFLAADGFETYHTVDASLRTELARRYTVSNSGNIYAAAGGISDRAIEMRTGSTLITIPHTAVATIITGFRLKFSAAKASRLVDFMRSGGQECQLELTAAGELRVLGPAVSQIITTSGLALAINTWYYIEVLITRGSSSNGTVTIRVDETQVASSSSLTTHSSGAGLYDALRFRNSSTSPNEVALFYDDIYAIDNQSPGPTTFLGKIISRVQAPSATATNNWTVSSGTAHGATDEIPANDDTDYVSSSTPGQECLLNMSDVSGRAALGDVGIKAVLVSVTAKHDGTATNFKIDAKSSSTYSRSGNITPGASYAQSTLLVQHDPATSGNWSKSSVNSASFGVEVA